jgi:hypothetical protein
VGWVRVYYRIFFESTTSFHIITSPSQLLTDPPKPESRCRSPSHQQQIARRKPTPTSSSTPPRRTFPPHASHSTPTLKKNTVSASTPAARHARYISKATVLWGIHALTNTFSQRPSIIWCVNTGSEACARKMMAASFYMNITCPPPPPAKTFP